MKMNEKGRYVLCCFGEHEGRGAEDLSRAHEAEGWNELLLLNI